MAGVNGAPQFDQRGEPFTRVYGGRIDIGAFEAQPNLLAGDYNFDGVVDLGDYVVWRHTLGSPNDLRADGNADGDVNQADHNVWRAHFGEAFTPRAASRSTRINSAVFSGTGAFRPVRRTEFFQPTNVLKSAGGIQGDARLQDARTSFESADEAIRLLGAEPASAGGVPFRQFDPRR